MVELVEEVAVADKTNLPAIKPKPKPKPPNSKPNPKPAKPKAAPKPKSAPEPKAAVLADSGAGKKIERESEKPKPIEKPKAPGALVKVGPKRKPNPPDPFASVLKTVENLKTTAPAKEEEDKKRSKNDFLAELAKAIASKPTKPSLSDRMTISEIDLVKAQIRECWNVPAGAREAEDLIIEIKVDMGRDGVPRNAWIESRARMGEAFYRAAAESALRAVLNNRCHPFKLPPQKYDQWHDLRLVFNPRDMF